jgi:hypothetical protein
MRKFMIAAALAVAALSGNQAQAEKHLRIWDGSVMPKHECATTPCVDCTFLSYEACYAEADRAGLVDKNVGFKSGQRAPLRLDRKEMPLEAECERDYASNPTSYYLPYGKGQIVCPVKDAVAVDAPPMPRRSAEPWLPAESPGGDAAIGIFFAQNCPGYLTPAARQTIHTFSQFRAREATQPYNELRVRIVEGARGNGTSMQKELHEWCMAAEPRVDAIQDKLGQMLK